MHDPVREYLRQQGYAEYIVEGGFDYLLDDWESLVEAVRNGELPDDVQYARGMDRRRILDETLPLLPLHKQAWYYQRVFEADAELRSLLEPTDEPLCGTAVAREKGYTPDQHWWYYHRLKLASGI